MRKGILVVIIGIIISSMMPFSIYANSQNTIIVPTWDSSTTQSQWDTHLTVENYCEGTNASTNSCKLMFTVDSNYYGYIYFDGYVGNTKWIDFQMVFIADGYGEYNYNLWSNGQISINRVNIAIVNLLRPDTTVDLTQIIQLLTAIESDTNAIESYTSQTLNQIRSVLSQLIISNGYLQTLTKLRQLTIPYESFPFIAEFLSKYDPITYRTYYSYQFPLFNVDNTFNISYSGFTSGPRSDYIYKFWINKNIQNVNDLLNYFKIYNPQNNNSDISVNIESVYMGYINYELWHEITIIVPKPQSGNLYIGIQYINSSSAQIMPIYKGYSNNTRISTDFALLFGFDNQLLNDLHIIANGTTQSNSAASGLEQNNNQMASDMNSLATIESGYNQDFNSQMQNIDFSNPITNNQGLLPAANFVITVFNGLINNNPFSVLIIVCCILLIGKKVIGK